MKIKPLDLCVTLFFVSQSFVLGIYTSNNIRLSGVDSYLTPFIGASIGFIYFLIVLYIFNYKSNLNINKLNKYLFGKFGTFINIILILFISFCVMILNWDLMNFVSSQFLYDTPQFFISILFIIAFIYLLRQDKFSIARTLLIFFYIFCLLAIISILGLIFQVKISNLLPFLENGITPVINSSISYIAYMVLPTFFILGISKDEIEGKNLNKKLIITYILGAFSIFNIIFLTVGAFGIELSKLYQFPSYHVLKRVLSGTFIDKAENLLAIQNIIVLFSSMTYYLYYIQRSIKENFPKIKNYYFYIWMIILLYVGQYTFKNNTIGESFFLNIFPIIIICFMLGITLLIFFKIIYKKRSIT